MFKPEYIFSFIQQRTIPNPDFRSDLIDLDKELQCICNPKVRIREHVKDTGDGNRVETKRRKNPMLNRQGLRELPSPCSWRKQYRERP